MRASTLVFLCGFLISSASIAGQFEHVSMIKVIANPEDFQGKEIQLSGYLKLGHEHNVLYFDKEHAIWAMGKNAVWLDLKKEQLEKWSKHKDSYVYVRGIFYAVDGMYFGGYELELKNISRIAPKLSPDDKKKMIEESIDEYNEGKADSEKIKKPGPSLSLP